MIDPSRRSRGAVSVDPLHGTAHRRGHRVVVVSCEDSYGNALTESAIGLYKTEAFRRRGPWRGLDDVELATLTWVAWYNAHRLLEPLGYIPPAEFEQAFYEGQAGAGQPAVLTSRGIRETRGGSTVLKGTGHRRPVGEQVSRAPRGRRSAQEGARRALVISAQITDALPRRNWLVSSHPVGREATDARRLSCVSSRFPTATRSRSADPPAESLLSQADH